MTGADAKLIIESLLRWAHIIAGVLWIGLLYFFNWVNANFAPTMDGETKKKVVPQLLPRTLYFFRWGAAYTWITGVLLVTLLYYHGPLLFESGESQWGALPILMVAVVFGTFFLYDVLAKSALKDPKILFISGWIYASVMAYLMRHAGFSFRGYAIHVGVMFGTMMAANVWMRIWPAQQKIITAIKNGEKPDDALVALAGARSKHNTYMSVPLLFMMMSQHATWAAHPGRISLVILVGFLVVYWIYGKAKKVPGF